MLKDRYGNSLSTQSGAALAKYDEALELIRLYRGDPIGTLDAALDHDPDFGAAWAARAGVLVQQTDKAYAEEIERSLRAGAAASCTARDRAHFGAVRAWADGRWDEGVSAFARIAREHPRDLLALQTAHVGCFFLGRASDLRDWPLQGLRAFRRGDDGYHAVMGMAAFGYEECGDYARAEAAGVEAVEIEPRDGWAVHAVAHVHEMRGDRERGIPWLADNAHHWAPESGFAYHNWWHLALLHMDAREHAAALKLYDEKVRPNPEAQAVLEWIDASALLWRLKLEGVDVGDRFAKLADCWTRAAEDRVYAFNDVHAVMAFIGAARGADVHRTLDSLRKAAAGEGDNAHMSRAVGLPLAEALVAFDAGRYADAVDRIAGLRGYAHRFGGSHAQRDIFSLTALHAALRGGMKEAAAAFAFERTMHKPHSPWAQHLARAAAEIGGPIMAREAAAA